MIYLDHNATTGLLPEVLEAMRPWMGCPANPSSVHRAGQRAAAACDEAAHDIANLLGVSPRGLVFTSGATEANRAALLGGVARHGGPVWASAMEHPSVTATAEELGWQPLEVSSSGAVLLPTAPVGVLSLQAANHETGVIQPDPRGSGCFVHVDATQAVGRIELSADGLDAVTLSGHKLGGPPGIGALWLAEPDEFHAWMPGGGQQRGLRGGTLPTALVVGLGAACRLALKERSAREACWFEAREVLEWAVARAGGQVLGQRERRLPNTVCASFSGLRGEALVQAMDLRGLCVSAGAACASGSTGASPVLQAMGHPRPRSAVRVSLGPRSTLEEAEQGAQILVECVEGLRAAAAFEELA